MTKQELRKIYLRKRIELSDAEWVRLNKKVIDNFLALPDLSSIRVLHTFLPIKKNREVDTWMIIEQLTKKFPQIKISVPRISNQSGGLDNFYFEGAGQLANNTWGIPEPVYGIPAPTEAIDAVLVPLLAFDKKGNRVGYGRGFYDKFLATCRADCKKIGLSFFEMVGKIEGIDDKDIPLNLIVTPEATVRA
jgi:5-formyltetrahydrofolate cyclo-ligase